MSVASSVATAATATTAAAGSANGKAGTSSSAGAANEDAAGTDPIATALALLSQSLAGALSGAQAAPPSITGSVGNCAADAIAGGVGLLKGSMGQNIASLLTSTPGDPKDAANSASSGSGGSAAAAGTDTSSSSAALNAAAQLSTASHSGVQQPGADATASQLRNPVATPAWNEELGGHMTWMAHQGIESASLRLSPEHLGPLDIRISVQHGQASVWFGASQADTRAALEQALPRLRELFANQGMTLTDAGVSRDTPKGQQHTPTVSGISGVSGVSGNDSSASQPISVRLGLLDTYA